MLELRHIEKKACDICGAAVECVERINRHCNGHWNEHVTYSCGCKLHFSPNFMRVLVAKTCPHAAEEVTRREGNRAYLKALTTLAEGHPGAEDDLRERALRELSHLLWPFAEEPV